MKNSIIAIGTFCLLPISSSFAEDYTDSLLGLSWEELTQVKVIIATGTEQAIDKAPANVSVITAEDIKKTGATNLADILESVPGIHVRYGSFGFRPLIHIRGANSHQTLLMVNGTPMKDLMWAFGIFWKGVPASAIERIEIIRGPGSALYGADAIAGVVNIISKAAAGVEDTEIGLRAGRFDSQTAFVQSGGKWQGFELAMTAEVSTTDGHDPLIELDRSKMAGKAQYGWNNQDIRFSLGQQHWRFLASYMKHNDLQTGITGSGNLDPVTNANDERYDLDLLYNNKQFSSNWGLEAKLHYQHLEYSSGDGFRESSVGIFNHMSSSERQMRVEAIGLYSGISGHSIRMGAGYNWQDLYRVEQYANFQDGSIINLSGTPMIFAPEKTRKIHYLFVQDIWTLADDWELTMGVRYDQYSDFGGTVNPRLALIWQGTDKLTTKLMYGQGFRAPSFQELYADTARSDPNPDLDPEKSETFELAFSYTAAKNLQLGLNLYSLELTDNISRDEQTKYQNTGSHKTHGVELEANWQVMDKLIVSGNYSWRDPDNSEFRNAAEPEQSAYLRADWQFSAGWNYNVQANWIADRYRSDTDPRSSIDDYVLTDTTLRYASLKHWEFTASVRNLFDEDAREHTGNSIANDLPLPERNFYAELRYKF